jgi:(2Fe-2S) ferredoxin
MPYQFNPLVSAVFVSSLAAAMFLCLNLDAGAASECVGKPDLSVSQAGHWYYHIDRVHHRRCWFFESSKATVSPAASADRVPARNMDSQQSWFLRLTKVLVKSFSRQPEQSSVQQSSISAYSSEPPQNTVVDNSITTKLTSPNHLRANKLVSRERSQTEPSPATNGVANAQRYDQLPGNGEKNEKPARQLTDTERQALFDDFLKWYQDRSVFGGRER